MSTLQNKIDFVALISVNMANANGDPLNGNRPRTDYNNYVRFPMCASSEKSATGCRIKAIRFLCSLRTGVTMALAA